MEIKGLVTSQKGTILADVGDGKYIAKAGTMELAVCSKVEEGYLVEKCVIAGWMMKTDKDFIDAVKSLKKEEIV